jgi:hypothetical protein
MYGQQGMYGAPGMYGGPGMQYPPGMYATPPRPQMQPRTDPKEEALTAALTAAIQPIAHLEKEWDSQKFQKKMTEYMSKAAKINDKAPIDDILESFCTKFYESYWRALGDRYSYVEKIDFSDAMVAGVKYYFEPHVWQNVPDEALTQGVLKAHLAAFDNCRWYSWGYQVCKTVIPGKTTQKTVSNAVDTARAELIKLMATGEGPMDIDTFMDMWIKRVVPRVSTNDLSAQVAVRLFNELVQEGGGLPHVLQLVAGKPPPNWPVVESSVSQAYQGLGGGAMGGFGGFGGMMGKGGFRASPY